MSKHKLYVAKHKAPVASRSRRIVRSTVIMSGIAVAATGATVATGVLGANAGQVAASSAGADLMAVSADTTLDADVLNQRAQAEPVSRSGLRDEVDRRDVAAATAEPALLSAETEGNAITRTEDHSDGDPKEIAKVLLAEFGFGSDQFSCLDSLWTRESNWRWNADNPTSSAYGIPQALPGSKMASAGADWATNPVTQIRWGLGYIQDRYGTPCGAWGHSQSHNWY
ncbi:aggregation-promoting factor C-terminal-like domain-containing protein [Nocardioides alcanivorans]|uniref:aggregation-promoting factor C-terminal-like domain-containing protein n=1 Tax=Nocardioides alcanivorans TaxID=2897352 RepID=UPI001F20373A|nr:lytic transglycosylase domain-containing protein [Nocardioides alcanivorans]